MGQSYHSKTPGLRNRGMGPKPREKSLVCMSWMPMQAKDNACVDEVVCEEYGARHGRRLNSWISCMGNFSCSSSSSSDDDDAQSIIENRVG